MTYKMVEQVLHDADLLGLITRYITNEKLVEAYPEIVAAHKASEKIRLTEGIEIKYGLTIDTDNLDILRAIFYRSKNDPIEVIEVLIISQRYDILKQLIKVNVIELKSLNQKKVMPLNKTMGFYCGGGS